MVADPNDPNFQYKVNVIRDISHFIVDTMHEQGMSPDGILILGNLEESQSTEEGFIDRTTKNVFLGRTND